jgi:hypothetical protein
MQKENTQEETMLESDPIIVKDYTKADRLMKSEAARARRKNLKETLETKILHEWAKARRDKKAAKKK